MAKKVRSISPLLERIPAPLKNKYIITLAVFFILLLFHHRVSLWQQWKLIGNKKKLEQKRDYYKKNRDEVLLDKRDSERDIEKFAREKYFMKKKDEDVFIIVDESLEKKNQ